MKSGGMDVGWSGLRLSRVVLFVYKDDSQQFWQAF